jgi:hypothetical protein
MNDYPVATWLQVWCMWLAGVICGFGIHGVLQHFHII